jgi:hypothetical protein
MKNTMVQYLQKITNAVNLSPPVSCAMIFAGITIRVLWRADNDRR